MNESAARVLTRSNESTPLNNKNDLNSEHTGKTVTTVGM
jgi:hypothetical protein